MDNEEDPHRRYFALARQVGRDNLYKHNEWVMDRINQKYNLGGYRSAPANAKKGKAAQDEEDKDSKLKELYEANEELKKEHRKSQYEKKRLENRIEHYQRMEELNNPTLEVARPPISTLGPNSGAQTSDD